MSTRRLRTLALCLLAGTAFAVLPVATSRSLAQSGSSSVALSIASMPVPRALADLSVRAGLQVLYSGSRAYKIMSRPVNGTYAPEEALRIMLAGTGINWRFVGANAVTIMVPGEDAAAGGAALQGIDGDGAIALDAIDVTGQGSAADRPFETPGSTNFISGEEIERFPPQTAGALFQGTPGVISGGGNNGASIDPNIRGLQGQNRVATTIDGSQQSTSSYRGYSGIDSRTYVDPDLISGITITKGPDGAVAGAIGGTIAMETLNVEDILGSGQTWGVRVRGGLASNSVAPVIGETAAVYGGSDAGELTNGSFAVAAREDNVDVIGAFVRRKTGNYFAGTQGSLTTTDYLGETVPLSNYGHGQLVYNTSEDVTSALLKATVRPTDEQLFQIGYLYYGNEFGEVSPSFITAGNETTSQIPLSSVEINQATLRYNYTPTDNDLVDFKFDAYASNTDETNIFASLGKTPELKQQSQNVGVKASNTSHFAVAGMPLAVSYGGSYVYENARPTEAYDLSSVSLWAIPANGEREIGSIFARVKWEPTDWLELGAGVEYLTYSTSFNGITTYGTPGDPFTSYSGEGFSPSASVVVTPVEGWQIYGQYQAGIRPPSVREVSQTRSDQIFNAALQAEEASNWEFGTNFLRDDVLLPGDKLRLKLAYFDNTTDNYIGREFTGSMGLFNYDFVRFRGVEFSGRYDAGRFFTDFGINYYTDFESCEMDGNCTDYTLSADFLTNQIPPRFTASVTAGARFFDERLTLGGRVTYMSERLAEVEADSGFFAWVTKVWEPYTVVDAFAQWKLNSHLTLDISVQNLLDTYYVDALNNTDMPAPGRTFMATLTGTFGSDEPITPLPIGLRANGERWTGLYAGGSIGYGFGSIDGTTTLADGSYAPRAFSESANETFQGGVWGGQAGYNYQFSNGVVVGVEADLLHAGMGSSAVLGATESATLITNRMTEAQTDYSFDWLATVRAKAGYAVTDQLLVYGTAGVAFLRETEERTQYVSNFADATNPGGNRTALSFSETSARTRTGFTVGGGAEYAINDRWSVKAEYAFAGFGAESFNFGKARSGVTRSYSTRTQTGTVSGVRSETLCATRGGRYCEIVERPVYETKNYVGTSTIADGREASNSASFQAIKIGVNYRF
ncbi:TonB-dependent receptor domain-containing protein [Ancylobacter sp. TS-1]|uniref:TonB-dependent receptor domain-containing protein n=1 Tax=Ancylobacter sp. TS-1 TaxID=1850374 RepID=UPI001265C11F|nr:TonB-dependent receptor [Ancylobacter sp. TS-1]QFR34945.1 TonB-dependent receptor plug domain-containing protein [Ancylobacter sp. TS-1]